MWSKIQRYWDKLWEILVIALLFGILVLAFVQVIFRYVLGSPLTWSEAICCFMYVWMVFVGSAVVMLGEGHLTLTFFLDRMPHKIQRSMRVAANLLVLFILVLIFLKEGIYLTKLTSTQISATVRITLNWVYVAIPVGGLLMAVNIVRKTVKLLIGRE